MRDPSSVHLKVAKRVLRYVEGTTNDGIHYTFNCKLQLKGFNDSDWDSDLDDKNSTSGNCFSLGSGLISWSSVK